MLIVVIPAVGVARYRRARERRQEAVATSGRRITCRCQRKRGKPHPSDLEWILPLALVGTGDWPSSDIEMLTGPRSSMLFPGSDVIDEGS